MTTIVTRASKGLPLSYTEMDANFNNLNNDKVGDVNPSTSGTWIHTGNAQVLGTLVMGSAFGFRNKIINAGCLVKQRSGVILANATSQYGGVDRFWCNVSTTTVTNGIIQIGSLPAFTSKVGVGVYQVTTTGATTGAIGQRIEALNCVGLNSKTVTISGKVRNGLGVSTTCNVSLYKPASLDTWATDLTGMTLIGQFSFSAADTTYTSFSGQVTLGATDADNGLCATVSFSAGALTLKEFWLGDFQLEEGSIATPFENRPYGLELALCQRYYFRAYPNSAAGELASSAYAISGTQLRCFVKFPVPMRTPPTSLEQTGTAADYTALAGTAGPACSSVPMLDIGSTVNTGMVLATIAAGFTAGWGGYLRSSGTAAFLGFPAEL